MTPNAEYQEYLDSDSWKIRRQNALDMFGNRCTVCNTDEKPLDVHHRTYENFKNELALRDLIVLCRKCHELFETNKRVGPPGDTKYWRAVAGSVAEQVRQAWDSEVQTGDYNWCAVNSSHWGPVIAVEPNHKAVILTTMIMFGK